MDLFALHALDLPGPARIAVGALAGLLAALLATIPMQRLPEGATPPFVVAGAVTDEPPGEVDPRLASVLFYVGGAVTGSLFVAVSLALEAVLPFVAAIAAIGLRIVPLALAILATFALLVAGFSYVVLPKFGAEVMARAVRIRRDWVVSTSVYTVALVGLYLLLVASV